MRVLGSWLAYDSFNPHGVFFLLKIPVRPEDNLPFLNSPVGLGCRGDTPILRRETPKCKINTKPHKTALYKAFICVGMAYQAEVPGRL